MKYAEALQLINPYKVLYALNLSPKAQGGYLAFPCPACQEPAVIKTHSEKKNVWYCPKCKDSGNIISLVMRLKKLEYLDAKTFCLEKVEPQKEITEELPLNYDLEWCELLNKEGIDKELCDRLGVGKPKGKTMLSGTIAFTVHNEHGLKVAYFGLKPDGTKKFHQSFNPELYLYNVNNVDPREEVWLTTDMLRCLKHIQDGRKALCNFGLPYLSPKQYEMLNAFPWVTIEWLFADKREISVSVAQNLKAYHRFV